MLYLVNKKDLFQDSFDDGNSSTFKTSPEVIQKVMNVPMCAVMSILRSNGYNDINDETSLCIDEKRLGIFTEAYIRKMKYYFTRSLQNIGTLPRKERDEFYEFNKLFKKKGIEKPQKWDADIDIDRLKEAFIGRIKEETEELCNSRFYTNCFSSDELIQRIWSNAYAIKTASVKKEKHIKQINISAYVYKLVLYSLGIGFEQQTILEKRIEEEKELLRLIADSEYYITEPIDDKPVWCGTNLINRFVPFARYYIYSVRDDDDSHSADINFFKKNISLISTGLRLCS